MSSRRSDTERTTRTSTPKRKEPTPNPERYTAGGEFSSDDEVDTGSKGVSNSPGQIGTMEWKDAQELVDDLSDKDIYDMLIELGQSIGPIVDTTRSVYKNLLTGILAGKQGLSMSESQTETVANGNGVAAPDDDDVEIIAEFSDSDLEEMEKAQSTPSRDNSEFGEYYKKFVSRKEAKSSVSEKAEHDGEASKMSQSRKSISSSASAPAKFSAPAPAGMSRSRDSPNPVVPKVATTYRRTPTPNPQLSAVNRASAKLGAGDEAEPTVLKRKTVRKILGIPKHPVPNAEIENANPGAPGWIGITVLFAIVVALVYCIYKVAYSGGLTEDEMIDQELDELIKNIPE